MNARRILLLRLFRLIAVLILPTGTLVNMGIVQAEPGTQSELTEINGTGVGRVNISPVSADQGTFAVEITIIIHDTEPGTTFHVRRYPDFNPDGICTGPRRDFGVTFTTSEGGAGATHFHFESGAIVSGTTFDVFFQVFNEDESIVFESECMTVTVK